MAKKVTRTQVVEVLVDSKYLTREEQATALGISRVTLWERLKADPTIEQDVAQAVREATANTVRNGFVRMHTIISNKQSKDADAIRALELVLKSRGELVEKREFSGGFGVTDQRLNRVMEETNDDNLRDLIASGTGSAVADGGGGARKAKGK